jgi:hypothetical protein
MVVLDLRFRLRCRECGARGRCLVSIEWGSKPVTQNNLTLVFNRLSPVRRKLMLRYLVAALLFVTFSSSADAAWAERGTAPGQVYGFAYM